MSDLYGVIGSPISHSLSPKIHEFFARQTGQDLKYEAIASEPANLQQTIEHFIERGGRGLNVTLPFKTDVLALADKVSEPAKIAHAANTLVIENGRITFADNTDGSGFMADLKRLNLEVAGKQVLIIGAGGACRGILNPLLQAQANIFITNRTHARALNIAQDFAAQGTVTTIPYGELIQHHFDVVINTSSTSLNNELPNIPEQILTGLDWAYDLFYFDISLAYNRTDEGRTPFTHWLKGLGTKDVHDGLGMLVAQAAESFYIWRGVNTEVILDIEKVLRMLRGGK